MPPQSCGRLQDKGHEPPCVSFEGIATVIVTFVTACRTELGIPKELGPFFLCASSRQY